MLTDPGAGEYTKQYFGKERYSFLCNGSQGHSVPVIDGSYQQQGRAYEGKILDVQTGPDKDVLVMDIAQAYAHDRLQSLIRRLTFEKKGKGRLVVQDRYTFREPPASIVERFVTFLKPTEIAEGRVRIQGRRTAELVYDADQLACTIQRADFVNHQSGKVDLYLIDLAVKSPGVEEQVTVSVEIG
ncbi:hypothetical protein [Paenibacillus cremeus]|uniref:Uncharacterized protein n=1 Tax=Paenibacillus cremeus TaxID=2163881 RepID=A0A559KIQ0_9BACL|nr:hypothetical protein [Paenibacillus cremeus]TVY12020.1 hypothetical protein FPZ49_01740 [Paenibacillus cremeus]